MIKNHLIILYFVTLVAITVFAVYHWLYLLEARKSHNYVGVHLPKFIENLITAAIHLSIFSFVLILFLIFFSRSA